MNDINTHTHIQSANKEVKMIVRGEPIATRGRNRYEGAFE